MATLNRIVLGTSHDVIGGAIDWTIAGLTKLCTYPKQITSIRDTELHMPDQYVWMLGFGPSDLPATLSYGTKVTFRLVVWRKMLYSGKMDALHTGRLAVRCKLSILDDAGKEVYHQGSGDFRSKSSFSARNIEIKNGCGSLTENIPSQRIWYPNSREAPLLYNDTLNTANVALPSLKSDIVMAHDYTQLYKWKEGTDLILVSKDNKEFAVHRTVLRARSSYFASMLTFNSTEATFRRYRLPDVDAQTLEVFLLFMYGSLTEVPADLVQSVFITADKYQFSLLKNHCEAMLMGQVMIGTAAHFLILADRYSASELREACLKIIRHGFKIFREAGEMKKLETDGSGDLLKVVKDIVEPKQPS